MEIFNRLELALIFYFFTSVMLASACALVFICAEDAQKVFGFLFCFCFFNITQWADFR